MNDENAPVLPRWAPLLRPETIRRLYASEAMGATDDELLDEVAYGILARCESICEVMDACERERVRCPVCGKTAVCRWKTDRDALIVCPCGWTLPWQTYRALYKRAHLHGGGAMPPVEDYRRAFPLAKSPEQRMLLIDRLLHAFHWELTGQFTRPVARGFIEGTLHEVVALLLDLTYGAGSPPERMTERDRFVYYMYTKTAWALPAEYRNTEVSHENHQA